MQKLDTEKLKEIANYIIKNSASVVLNTCDENGFPEARAMLSLKQNSLKNIWFTTNTSSNKIKQIRKNDKVSVYFCFPEEWKGLCIIGKIEIVEDMETKKEIWQDGWEMYYPKGVQDEDYSVLKFSSMRAYFYHNLEKHEFEIN